MEIETVFLVIAVLIGSIGMMPYVRDVLFHQTQPHAFTWLIWSITQGTATAALWYGGGGTGAIALTIGTTFAFLIFILSLFDGTKNITKSDVIVLVIALLAIVIWWLLENPLLAVLIVTGIDVIGYIPTFRKSYSHPWTETAMSWGVFGLANVFVILALESYNSLTLTYLVAITVANFGLMLFLFIRRRQLAGS